MVAKDDYATTSPLNEGATGGNTSPSTYISDSPLGNVRIYDLDAVVPPIERMQIAPNVPNLAPSIPANTPAISEVSETTTTIAPMSDSKKPNYLVYGGGALAVGLVAYMLLKKN